MDAEQVLQIIKNLDADEKYKLLDELFHLYYDKRGLPRAEYDDE